MPSPFFNPGTTSSADQLAILHLRRDALVPTILRTHDDEEQGYDEGKVVNTRFGSFPHTTLIDRPWGSQIIASDVNTGKRSRTKGKRKAAALADGGDDTTTSNAATAASSPKAASSGFIHLLPPTPESWTSALPHRTQVVYTPDYSYILHRLRASPGKTIIEAGAGSGSFTHAAARAVFNGYASHEPAHKKQKTRFGKVCSFEFHATRATKVQEELKQHGLEDVVRVTHRDVYNDGFLLPSDDISTEKSSPKANAIFLDLPAPWLALKHLTRHPTDGSISPLDPSSAVRICTFSPCMEQVQKTISVLRQQGWLQIQMVEVLHRRIEVRREVVGLETEGVRRAMVYPRSVEEAVGKLRVVEGRLKVFQKAQKEAAEAAAAANGEAAPIKAEEESSEQHIKTEESGERHIKTEESDEQHIKTEESDEQQQQTNNQSKEKSSQIPSYEMGRLVHRTEPDLKTHTSYLVFAVLPRAWSAEDERKAREQWPSRPT